MGTVERRCNTRGNTAGSMSECFKTSDFVAESELPVSPDIREKVTIATSSMGLNLLAVPLLCVRLFGE